MTPQPAVRGAAWALGAFYLLIALEFFYMASPFALYAYGAYLPGLESLNRVSGLAWLTRFFLPHYAATSSALVNSAAPAGGVLAALGLLGFLIGAAQVYSRKLLKRGAAVGGIYRWVRHPQYAALILAGAGMLLLWPRFLMVVFFVTMLFVYRGLASVEERECLARYGKTYAEYRLRTARFFPLPVPLLAAFAERLSERHRGIRLAAGVLAYLFVMAAALGGAFGLQAYTLRSLSAHEAGTAVYVSLTPLPKPALAEVVRTAETDPRIRPHLAARGARFIGYVMPWEWGVTEIPMNDVRDHHTPDEFDSRKHKVVYARAVFRDAAGEGLDILRYAVRSEPVAEVWIDEEGRIARVLSPPAKTFYGAVPVPLF